MVVDGGPTLNPSTNDILKGIDSVPAREVLVLPNSPDVFLAAKGAADLAEKEVVVIASDSQQAALAALVELNPDAPAAENATRLEGVLAEIRTGSVAPAVKDDADGRFVAGDCVGFQGEEVVAWGEPAATLERTLGLVADGAELVTVIAGEEAPIPAGEIQAPDGIELETQYGGQRHYYWLIAAQ